MKATHSNGPWEMTEIHDHEGGPPVYRVQAKSTLFLTVAPCADGYVPGENEANARLISAAPDLLEACRAALAAFGDAKFRPGAMSEKDADRFAAVLQLSAAIEKATGEPPTPSAA